MLFAPAPVRGFVMSRADGFVVRNVWVSCALFALALWLMARGAAPEGTSFSRPASVQREAPATPLEMALRLDRELARGTGMLMPDPERRVRLDGGIIPLDVAAPGFPAEFMAGLVPEEVNGVEAWRATLCADDATGDMLFYNAAGELFWSVAADADVWSADWIARLYSVDGAAADFFDTEQVYQDLLASPSRRRAQTPEWVFYRSAWLSTRQYFLPSHVEMTFTFVLREDLGAYRSGMAANRRSAAGAPTRSPTALTGLTFTGIQTGTNGVALSAAWPAGMVLASNTLDIFFTPTLAPSAWTNPWRVEVDPDAGGIDLTIPRSDLPPPPEAPAPACVTNTAPSAYAPGVTHTNVICTNAVWLTDTGFFRLADLADSDGDGLTDASEKWMHMTSPANPDSDGDGMPDGWEVAYLLDPRDPSDADGDQDGDGLINAAEYGLGTRPDCADSDGDGMDDLMEVQYGYDPATPNTDFRDSDNDGLNDFEELVWGTDPDEEDTDGDGLSDFYEIYVNTYHGHTNFLPNGEAFFGTDPVNPDCDGDGLNDGREAAIGTDPWEADTDNDGIQDGQEADTFYLFLWGGGVENDRFIPITNVVALNCRSYVDNTRVSCLHQDGTVSLFANNDTDYPPFSSFVSNAICAAIGAEHISAGLDDGRLISWRFNATILEDLQFESPVKHVACGQYHTTALLADGTVRTRFYGQDGSAYHRAITNQPSGLSGVASIASGYEHSVAVLSNGSVRAWGYDYHNYGVTNVPPRATNTLAVSCGYYHSMALQRDGRVIVWGHGGDRNLTNNAALITNAVDIACGKDNCMVLLEGRTNIVAWGYNFYTAAAPTTFLFASPVKAISQGYYGAAILENGHAVMLNMRQPPYLRVKDLVQFCHSACALAATDPLNADTDGDGLPDGWELHHGFNPLSTREIYTNSYKWVYDADSDGLTNLQEFQYGTDPRSPDVDGDGLWDIEEISAGTNPYDPDSDGDGINDGDEILLYGTDPNNSDTDGDGVPDGEEIILYGTSPTVPDDGSGTQPVPSPVSDMLPEWLTYDLGSPAIPGSAAFSGGTFTLTGGSGEAYSNDWGRVCFVPAWGNFTFTARINPGEGVGGIFIRRSGSPDAVKIELGADAAGALFSTVRQVPNGAGVTSNHVVVAEGDIWLRLMRYGSSPYHAGTLYKFMYSTNSTSWTTLRSVTLATVGAKAQVGLFSRGISRGTACSNVFTDVSFSHSDSGEGFAPFSLESDTPPLFTATNIITVQPLVTGLTFRFSTTTNVSPKWSYSELIRGMEPFTITNAGPAFVRVEACRSGSFVRTYADRFVSNRHLPGWLAYYTPFSGEDWPDKDAMETNATWVSHLLSTELAADTRTPESIRRTPHVVRLKTRLATPYSINGDGGSTLIIRLEYIGAVRVFLARGEANPRKLFDLPESESWKTVVTNSTRYAGLNTLNIDLRSQSVTPGVRLWWRSEYEPEFRPILLSDCFVADYNQNGVADEAREWFDPSTAFTPEAGSDADADGDGYSDFDEITLFRSNPFDASSRPILPAAGLSPEALVPGLTVSGFKDTGLPCARFYDAPFPQAVTCHVGALCFTAPDAFAPLLPSGNPNACGLVFNGFFYAETNGWYDFSLEADDRATLEINGTRLVPVPLPGKKNAGAYLLAGCHPLRLTYENRADTRSLTLSYRSPGADAPALVSGSLLFSLPGALSAAQASLDTDGDGIPDVRDANPGSPDPDADTDGDGVPDAEEREWAMTDPLAPDIASNTVWQSLIPAETGAAVAGDWFAHDGGICCASRNGAAVFAFAVPSNGVYRIDLHGREASAYAAGRPFCVELYVDGASCGQQTLYAPDGASGSVRFYTPFLACGDHTATVRWINTLEQHALFIESLTVSLPGGNDADGDGIADWMTAFAAEASAVSVPPASHTSPVCLEGRHAGTMEALILGGYPVPEEAPLWTPPRKRLPGNAWYADIPLASNGVTQITAGFAGLPAAIHPVEWTALNLAACREITVRRNDTLKFTLVPVGEHPVMLSASTNDITFKVSAGLSGEDTVSLATVPTNTPVFHTFDTAGIHTLRALWNDGGETYMFETHVHVIDVSFPSDPVLLRDGRRTRLQADGLSPDLWLDHDSRLTLERSADDTSLWATLSEGRAAYIAVRLYEDGPVLAATRAETLSFTSHNESGYMRYLYTLPGGTRVFEGRVSVRNLAPDMTLTIRFLSPNNYFENGSRSITYTAEDFDENGELVITMFVTGSSFCHRQTFSQGGAEIISY